MFLFVIIFYSVIVAGIYIDFRNSCCTVGNYAAGREKIAAEHQCYR